MQYDLKEVKKAVASSKTGSEALRKLGRRTRGSSSTHFFKYLRKHVIDFSHFTRRGSSNPTKKKHWSHFLVKDKLVTTKVLRRAMIESGIKHECNECGLGDEWNGRSLVLQIEHKDGDHRNNDPSNVTFLCPNCHSQTETYGAIKGYQANRCECGKTISPKATRCLQCANKVNGKLQQSGRPAEDVLRSLVAETPIVKIAKLYGVSDKTVSKWCDHYGIVKPGRGYWAKKKSTSLKAR